MTEGGGSQPCKTLKLLAACGVIAPVLLTALWIVAGLIRPGYNHLTQYGSELGVGSNSILMNANFVLFGLLITPLALGLHKGINQGRGSRIGPALIVVVGATFIGSGVFPASGGFSGAMHQAMGAIGGSAIIVAILAIWRRLNQDDRWNRYRSYSLASSLLALVTFILAIIVVLTDFLSPWDGAVQRIWGATWLLWIEITAIRLLRLSFGAPVVPVQT